MAAILWIIAVVVVIAGIVQIFQGQVILGIALIIVGLLIGPGGVSIFASTGVGLAGALPIGRGNRRRPALTPRQSVAPTAAGR